MEIEEQDRGTTSAKEVSNNTKLPKDRNQKMFLLGVLGLVVLVLLGVIGVGVYRVYAQTATDNFTLAVARTLKLPALRVNDTNVPYTEYADDLQAIQRVRAYDQANNGQYASLTDEQMSDQVLLRLANNVLVEQAAKEYDVQVDSEGVEALRRQLVGQFADEATAGTELEKRYGWDLPTYQRKVMEPFVLQRSLNEKIVADTKLRDEVYNRASGVLEQIKNGADFSELAKEHGSDGTASRGGDLGWFKRGVMVLPFEQAVFGLDKGALSQELVETSYGYHIVQLDDKRTSTEEDDEGNEVEVEEIKARHILFTFPNLNTYLDKEVKEAEFKLKLKVHDPFEDLDKVGPGQLPLPQ